MVIGMVTGEHTFQLAKISKIITGLSVSRLRNKVKIF